MEDEGWSLQVYSADRSRFTTHPRPRLQQHGLLRYLRDGIETLLLVGTVYAFVNLATARFIVEGSSMFPNFDTGQFLMVSRANYLLGQPQRGDIVVFHYPLDPQSDFIKRVIGLPGETVEIRDTLVFVDGIQLQEPYIREACLPTSCPDSLWQLNNNEYFVMGDNRNQSRDSRAFGPIDRHFIIGEGLVRYWPPGDWAIVAQFHYPVELNP